MKIPNSASYCFVLIGLLILLMIYRNIECGNALQRLREESSRKYFETPSIRTSEEPQKTTSTTKSINFAPTYIQNVEDACKSKALWGREHHGGWYICEDNLTSKPCIVYSYGLGKLIYFPYHFFALYNGCLQVLIGHLIMLQKSMDAKYMDLIRQIYFGNKSDNSHYSYNILILLSFLYYIRECMDQNLVDLIMLNNIQVN
jgi:hypothetical protein